MKRNSIKTPITTSVEECIKADAGVGASMASGNHTKSTNCAHLQEAAINIHNISNLTVVNSKKYANSSDDCKSKPRIVEKMIDSASVPKIDVISTSAINIQKSLKRPIEYVRDTACVVRTLL